MSDPRTLLLRAVCAVAVVTALALGAACGAKDAGAPAIPDRAYPMASSAVSTPCDVDCEPTPPPPTSTPIAPQPTPTILAYIDSSALWDDCSASTDVCNGPWDVLSTPPPACGSYCIDGDANYPDDPRWNMITMAGCPKDGENPFGAPLVVGAGFPVGNPPAAVYVQNIVAIWMGNVEVGWLYLGSDGNTYYQVADLPNLPASVGATFGPFNFSFTGPTGQLYTAPQQWQGSLPEGATLVAGWLESGWVPKPHDNTENPNCPPA
jgi:hypothetical protein